MSSDVEQLALVLVQALDLHVEEHRVRIEPLVSSRTVSPDGGEAQLVLRA
jgi:hypothetical protein